MLFARQSISLVAANLLVLTLSPPVYAQVASPERLQEITQHGMHVMPFDLKQTRHIFTKTGSGGVQQVIARSTSNTQQVELIRQHLSKISQEFSHGDFSNPAKIHGQDMPGLAELRKAAPGQLHVAYKELENGAEITYSSKKLDLIDAIHRWFDAQLVDHGSDAVPGHDHGAMHDMKDRHKQ